MDLRNVPEVILPVTGLERFQTAEPVLPLPFVIQLAPLPGRIVLPS